MWVRDDCSTSWILRIKIAEFEVRLSIIFASKIRSMWQKFYPWNNKKLYYASMFSFFVNIIVLFFVDILIFVGILDYTNAIYRFSPFSSLPGNLCRGTAMQDMCAARQEHSGLLAQGSSRWGASAPTSRHATSAAVCSARAQPSPNTITEVTIILFMYCFYTVFTITSRNFLQSSPILMILILSERVYPEVGPI